MTHPPHDSNSPPSAPRHLTEAGPTGPQNQPMHQANTNRPETRDGRHSGPGPTHPGTPGPDRGVPPRHPQTRQSQLTGVLAVLGAVGIWGLSWVPGKVALSEIPPFTLAVLRFSLALAIVAPIAWRVSPPPRALQHLPWRTLAALGFTGVTLFFGFQNLGLARTSASDAGLVAGVIPAVTAALSALVLRERIRPARLLGIAASIAGIATIILAGDASDLGRSIEGDLLVLGCAVAWPVYTLFAKGIGRSLDPTLLLAYTMAFGTLFLLPPAALEIALLGLGPISPTGWLSVAFLGVGGSAAAFFCWNTSLRHLDASEAATYLNLTPVVTVLSAALFLGDRLTPPQLLGGLFVLAGVYLASR